MEALLRVVEVMVQPIQITAHLLGTMEETQVEEEAEQGLEMEISTPVATEPPDR